MNRLLELTRNFDAFLDSHWLKLPNLIFSEINYV